MRFEVVGLEIDKCRERLNIVDDDELALDPDQIFTAKTAKDSVHVRAAETERVGDQLLVQRQAERPLIAEAYVLQPGEKLKQEMGHPFEGCAPANRDQVLRVYRGLAREQPE